MQLSYGTTKQEAQDIHDRISFRDDNGIRLWILFSNRKHLRIFHCRNGRMDLIGEIQHSPEGDLTHSLSFSDGITGWLEEAAENNAFDWLVLIAPPHTLDKFRHAFSPALLARTIIRTSWPEIISDKQFMSLSVKRRKLFVRNMIVNIMRQQLH